MVTEQDDNHPRRDRIRKYVREHPGATKTDVIKYMKRQSAVATTHKIIKDFVDHDVVIVKKDKKNSQIHHLYINDSNGFNRLEQELSRIENIIDSNTGPILRIFQSRYKAKTELERNDFIKLQIKFQRPYKNVLYIILQDLLVFIQCGKFSENPEILYTRVVKCFLKLTRQSHFLNNSTELINYNVKELKNFRNSSSFERCIEKKLVNRTSLDNLITKIEDFQRQFLNDLAISRNRNFTLLK